MAQSRQTAHEFIQNAFSPMVAVLCSHDAEQLCQNNNLSFVEMIHPFCRMSQEAQFRDPGNNTHTLRNLHIIVKDMGGSIPQPALARKMMSEAVSNSQSPPDHANNIMSYDNYDLQLNNTTPWFEAYREMFLQVAYPSEHEFLKHFLSCIYVVSSMHADPMDQFIRLTQQQNLQQTQSPSKLPKWFSPNILKYYVLLHDVSEGDEAKAEAVFQTMKNTYGPQACHLLQINSRPSLLASQNDVGLTQTTANTGMPDPWSQYITKTSDQADIAIDQTVPTLPPSQLGDTYYTPGQKLEPEPNFDHIHPVETASEVTEDSCNDLPVQPIDHPLAHIDEEEQYSLPRMMAEVSLPNSSSTQSFSTLDRSRPTQHGQCLTLSDHDRLRIFVHEFQVRGLIPWAERTMRILNEQIMSRKGIHRSLFSATRKWFGGSNKPIPTPGPQHNTTVIYTQEAPELQMRRFADLAFMFQQYELAYQTYHSLKKDFQNDNAWLHYAGAIELASLAIFMQGSTSQRQYPHHYMETATSTYLNTCRTPQFATRATMMNTEALKSKCQFAEAAMQFIKMTSEDSDLRSALMLEQAAHCFINMKVPMVRKYAFHMILAGHRFSKSVQRRHALRAYSQALQVYKAKHWSLAEDHINFTIGRQSFNLKQLENACSAFKHLLTRESRQTPAQQNAFFREYIFVYKQLLTSLAEDQQQTAMFNGYPQLPLPLIDGNATKVLVGGLRPNRTADSCVCASAVDFVPETDPRRAETWDLLEQQLVASCNQLLLHANYRPSIQCSTALTDNSHNPLVVVGEALYVELTLQNPLKVALVLSDLHLLWQFLAHDFPDGKHAQTGSHTAITNEMEKTKKRSFSDEVIDTETVAQLVIGPAESMTVQLSLTPKQTGDLHLLGLAYNLGSSPQQATNQAPSSDQSHDQSAAWRPSFVSTISVRGKQTLEVQGPRLNKTVAEKTSRVYGPDRRLDISVVPKMPLLDVKFINFPETMLCGEVRLAFLQLENHGQLPLHRLRLASRRPEFMTFGRLGTIHEKSVYQTLEDECDLVVQEIRCDHVTVVPLSDGLLKGGASVSLPVWIHGPVENGQHQIELLFYYETLDVNPKMKYRILRHLVQLETKPAVSLTAVSQRSMAAMPSVTDVSSVNEETGEVDDNNRNLVINLQVENLNQPHDSTQMEISLVQVSCVSRHWALRHLSTRPGTEHRISRRETNMMCFVATPAKLPCAESELVVTNVTFDTVQIDSSATPCLDFYCLSCSCPPLEPVPTSRPRVIIPDPMPETGPSFEALEVAVKSRLTLIVLWKALVTSESDEQVVLCGQHHVTLDQLNVPVTIPTVPKIALEQPPVKIIKDPEPLPDPQPSLAAISQLVKVTIQSPQRINHDFTMNRLCVVPVTVVLQNCAALALHIRMDTSSHPEPVKPDPTVLPSEGVNGSGASTWYRTTPTADISTNQPSAGGEESHASAVFWLGQVSYRTDLGVDAHKRFELTVCVSRPGVYNLSTIQVYAGSDDVITSSDGDVTMTKQKPYGPSLLVVNNVTQSVET